MHYPRKNKPVTLSQVKLLLDYDPATGRFTWLNSSSRAKCGKPAGSIKSKKSGREYRVLGICGQTYVAARIAYFYMTGEWPDLIDHINQNPLDDRWENLRSVSCSENLRNSSKSKANKTGATGVNLIKGRWVSQIMVRGKNIYCYRGSSFEAACVARKDAEIKYGYHENHGKEKNVKS